MRLLLRPASLCAIAVVSLLTTSPVLGSPFSPPTVDVQIQQCIADIDADSL